jgi:hypothetical protein
MELRLEFTNLFMGVGDDYFHLVESAYLGQSSGYDGPTENVRAHIKVLVSLRMQNSLNPMITLRSNLG